MPSIKLPGVKAVETKTGFESYDGPPITRKGFYRAELKKLKYGLNANSGSYGFNIVFELLAAPGDPKGHAIFDSMPMFSRSIITEGKDGAALKEGSVRNLSNFLAAIGSSDEPTVILEDGDLDDQVEVKKIGGINPVGRIVNLDIGFGRYEGEPRAEINGIYVWKDDGKSAGKVSASDIADDDADLYEGEEGEDEAEAEDDEYGIRQAELTALGIPELRRILEEDYDLPKSGNKAVLVERILEHEFADEEEADEAEAEDEEEPDDEAEDEAEDDEEEEADDEDEAAKAARVEELAGFDRIALKKVLKEVSPEATVLKRHTDDDIRELILDAEFGDELPF